MDPAFLGVNKAEGTCSGTDVWRIWSSSLSAHSCLCFPHPESLQKRLGTDPGWWLRLPAGRHPLPDCARIPGDRQ